MPQRDGMPSLLRRRVTPIGRETLSAAWGLPDANRCRFILSSRHGEFDRTFSLMQNLANLQELSPADFSLSVHHALTGLLSIALKNPAGHTALAAGAESFCFALVEAAACLRENPEQPVLLIHFDDRLPEIYKVFGADIEVPAACALLIDASCNGADAVSMSFKPAGSGTASACHMQDFVAFLQNGRDEIVSHGEKHEWRWSCHAG